MTVEVSTTDASAIVYYPTTFRKMPPTKLKHKEADGREAYTWFITKDEYERLCKIFGQDFEEANLGGTIVVGLPTPCEKCGKYTEFIDWVWTALQRKVHTAQFMFEALKDRRMPKENMHDVYCSQCGTLTKCRSRNNAEGGADAPHIIQAGRLRNADYPAKKEAEGESPVGISSKAPEKFTTWGKWWLDDNGSTKWWRDAVKAGVIQPASASH